MWQVTYLVLLAYAAFAAAPTLIGDRKEVANWVWFAVNSVCAVVAFGTAVSASIYLWSLHQADTERLEEVYEAGKKLPTVRDLHGWTAPDGANEEADRERPKANWNLTLVLCIAVVIGAALAIGINLLRIPWARIAACISQSASG